MSSSTASTIDDRVAAGAAWLDANRPGWWQRINLDTLDLGDPCKCVLGQEYGRYALAPEETRVGPRGGWRAPRFGFDGPMGSMATLTAAWRTLIEARRTTAPAAWPDRTHDGQRDRATDTADVDRGVL